MAKVISIALQKGGTGKTTTATVIAAMLGEKNRKVLLVDMDSQCNATFISGIDPDQTIIDVFSGDADFTDVITETTYYDIIPGDERLVNFEKIEEIQTTLLKNELAAVLDSYDYIILDTPPALGNILMNCLEASDYVIIPTDARPLAIKGFQALGDTIKSFPGLKVLGVVLVKFSSRSIINRRMKEMLEEEATDLDTTLFNSTIREGVAVAEAQALQIPLNDYAPNSNPCLDYYCLNHEIIQRIEGEK